MQTTEQVTDLVRRWARAEREHDADALDGLLAADFTGVGPLGFVLTRQQWLERYRGDALRNASFEFHEPRVRDYGDAAVVIGVQEQQTSYQGRDSSGRFRATLVVVRGDGRWLLAGVHLSPIMAPPRES